MPSPPNPLYDSPEIWAAKKLLIEARNELERANKRMDQAGSAREVLHAAERVSVAGKKVYAAMEALVIAEDRARAMTMPS